MPNMISTMVEDTVIAVHTDKPPNAAEWAEYMRLFKSVPPERMRNLVITDGGGPDSAQRKELNDYLQGRTTRAAIVSSSTMVRGIVIALSWFNPEIKVFSSDKVEAAFQYLDLPTARISLIWNEIDALRVRLSSDFKSLPKRVAGAGTSRVG